MLIYLTILVFILGLVIGSFLNVLIFRLHSGESAARGRSKCPHCGHVLAWTDLFPVLSFICLRRQCRYCQGKISWQYPLVELATGLLFALDFAMVASGIGNFPSLDFQLSLSYQSFALLIRDWIVIAALIVIFVYDLRWLIIPDQVVLPVLAIVVILNLIAGVPLAGMAIGFAVGLGFFGLQYAVSQGRWIGGGDLRLGALLGALLGWPIVAVALFIAYLAGAAVSLALIAQKKATAKSQVPLGVFLAPAAIVALFWGEKILTWYLG